MRSNKHFVLAMCVLPAFVCAAADEKGTPSQAATVGELLVLDSKQAVIAAKKALAAEEERKNPIPSPNQSIPNPSLLSATPGAPFGGGFEQPVKASPMGDVQVDGVYQVKGDAVTTTKVKVVSGGVSKLLGIGSSIAGWRLARASPVDGCAVFERSEEVAVKRKQEADEPTIRIETRSAKLCVSDASDSPIRGGGAGYQGVSFAPMPIPVSPANGTAMPVSSIGKP